MTIADPAARVQRAINILFEAGDADRIAALVNQIYTLCDRSNHAEALLALTFTLKRVLSASTQNMLFSTAVAKLIIDDALKNERSDPDA